MKTFLLSLFLMTSCNVKETVMVYPTQEGKGSPIFKVGDCTTNSKDIDKHEFLKQNLTIRKIKAVGKKNYLYEFSYRGLLNETSFDTYEIDEVRIDCPEYWK